MATFRLQYLANPKILRSIETRRLRALLAPHREYLRERGLDFCPRGSSPLDLESLIGILSAPTSETPQRLLDSLFLINELSTPQGMDALLAAAERACIPLDIDDRQSPADVAVQVWLHSPAILEQQHARVMLVRPRRFDSFQGQFAAPAEPLVPSSKQLKAIEHDLDNLYEAKRRGRVTRVFHYPAGEETRFLIRRGEPYWRDEALEDEGIVSLYYRPLRYDVVIYDWRTNELRINTSMPSAKPVYCRTFGKHLFGDPDRFPGMSKYTLQPLLDLGDDALACGDVDGIEWIKLTKVHFLIGGPEEEYAIRGATDFFAALDRRGAAFPAHYRMAEAVFRVKFADSKTPRSLRICPGNVAAYMRDSDAELAEHWMRLRGFILDGMNQKDGIADSTLAVA